MGDNSLRNCTNISFSIRQNRVRITASLWVLKTVSLLLFLRICFKVQGKGFESLIIVPPKGFVARNSIPHRCFCRDELIILQSSFFYVSGEKILIPIDTLLFTRELLRTIIGCLSLGRTTVNNVPFSFFHPVCPSNKHQGKNKNRNKERVTERDCGDKTKLL